MASRWRGEPGREINLTPLLDVIFCLLFFFVLATSLKQERRALDVEIPRTGQQARRIDQQEQLEVSITRENQVVFEGRPMTVAQLESALRAAARRSGVGLQAPDTLIIRTDGQSHMQTFVAVSDACARAGLESALVEARPESGAERNP